jgi:hypothetical protein
MKLSFLIVCLCLSTAFGQTQRSIERSLRIVRLVDRTSFGAIAGKQIAHIAGRG